MTEPTRPGITDTQSGNHDLTCKRCGWKTNYLYYGEACSWCYEKARDLAREMMKAK